MDQLTNRFLITCTLVFGVGKYKFVFWGVLVSCRILGTEWCVGNADLLFWGDAICEPGGPKEHVI